MKRWAPLQLPRPAPTLAALMGTLKRAESVPGGQLVSGEGLRGGGGSKRRCLRVLAPSHRTVWRKRGVVSSGAHLAGQWLQNGFRLNTFSFEWLRNFLKEPLFSLAEMLPVLGVCPSSIAPRGGGVDIGSAMAGVLEASVLLRLLITTRLSALGALLFGFRISSLSGG